jgi:hypothetical protein
MRSVRSPAIQVNQLADSLTRLTGTSSGTAAVVFRRASTRVKDKGPSTTRTQSPLEIELAKALIYAIVFIKWRNTACSAASSCWCCSQ